MDTGSSQVLTEIITKTDSSLIIFFVIMVIVLIVVVLPLYRMMIKDKADRTKQEGIRQDKYIEREKQVIQVITGNTEVMSRLSVTLEKNGATVDASLTRIHARIDAQAEKTAAIQAETAQLKALIKGVIETQREMASDINKTLLIVDSIPNKSTFSSQHHKAGGAT